MIVIVDNGKGALEISRAVRSSQIVKPSSIPENANGYILSDGDLNATNQKACMKFIKNAKKPVLGIGIGYIYFGIAFGARSESGNFPRTYTVTINKRSPLVLDLKKQISVVAEQKQYLSEISENLDSIGSSNQNPNEIIAHFDENDHRPLFGVHFNPELSPDGIKILQNFVKFVEMWNKYH
jgi:anthranilate/para-aminobenzoate synthase component II